MLKSAFIEVPPWYPVGVTLLWSFSIFEAHRARTESGPPLECARERGRFGEPQQIRDLVHRDLFPAQVVERQLVARDSSKTFSNVAPSTLNLRKSV